MEELNNVIEGIIGLAQQAPRLVFMRAFAQYFEGKPSGLNPTSVIRSSPYFSELRTSITDSIQDDFTAAREYVKVRWRAGRRRRCSGGRLGVPAGSVWRTGLKARRGGG